MLVTVDQIEKSVSRYYSWKNKVEEAVAPLKTAIIKNTKPHVADDASLTNIVTAEENRKRRREMLSEVAAEPVDFAYERAIGENDSVYSNFVELINIAKKKVGRIVVKDGSRNIGYATGFMVSERLLLTNWHVFEDEQSVGDSEVEFFYELDVFGRPGTPIVFKLNSKDFFYAAKELDYCFVAVDPTDVSGKINLSSIGYIFLDPALGKLGDEGKEALNIIHHPDGDYKQLSIRENLFTKILPTSLWYESDTAPGSSGSPVFNDQWQVVALHHMGVPSKTKDGKFFLDKNGNKIKPVDGKVDAAKINWIANEGIRISVILTDIFSKHAGVPLVDALKISGPNAAGNKTADQGAINAAIEQVQRNSSSNVTITLPVSMFEKSGTVSINVTNESDKQATSLVNAGFASASVNADELLSFDEKKLEREKAMDFSNCKGYEAKFLGTNIAFPAAKKSLQKYIAKLKGGNQTLLNYYHYSVLFHAVRRMPVVSAINIDGSPELRKDISARQDDWLRDNRLDYDVQLNDKFYALSGFDKGHMSRREDADWGLTPTLAKLSADVTCMYTNACPQVSKINRVSRGGLWGKLEELVLEHGAEKQQGTTAKISVFNGPIFKESDPVYKSIQIPMDFFKIILWLNDSKKLKATAFRLSQTKLVDEIDFEAISIDTNVEFKPYQCSIQSLEEATQLDFSAIKKFDTFSAAQKQKLVTINREEDVKQIMRLHKK